METVTISELKNRLSAFLRKVRAGGTILILDRDRPIARLEGVGGDDEEDEPLVQLERSGLLRRGRARVPLESLRAAAPKARRSVTQALIEDRREDR